MWCIVCFDRNFHVHEVIGSFDTHDSALAYFNSMTINQLRTYAIRPYINV